MADVEIVASPWGDMLAQLASEARHSIDVCSPFVNRGGTRVLLDATVTSINIRVVSKFNAAYFHGGYSETKAFRDIIARGGQVRNCQRLHAKVYLFDNERAVVTSSNLTGGGLRTNFECGVLLRDSEAVAAVHRSFQQLWEDEATRVIDHSVLSEIDDVLRDIPRAPRVTKEISLRSEQEEPDLVLEGAEAAIRDKLTGWKRAVFDVLCDIDRDVFALADVYAYAEHLASQYPDNENIEAKIRQQLQLLRDLGLVTFLGGGRYAKLWS